MCWEKVVGLLENGVTKYNKFYRGRWLNKIVFISQFLLYFYCNAHKIVQKVSCDDHTKNLNKSQRKKK